jgi:hypothetical protein
MQQDCGGAVCRQQGICLPVILLLLTGVLEWVVGGCVCYVTVLQELPVASCVRVSSSVGHL